MGEHMKVLIEDLTSHPHCAHGPTLLFRRTVDNSERVEEFFACSACRSRKECAFYVKKGKQSPADEQHRSQISQHMIDQDVMLRKIIGQDADRRLFCHTCGVFALQADEHIEHSTQIGISHKQLLRPTLLLKPLSNDKREAQYFFTDSTLKCFVSIFQQTSINKIVCIGTPRLHEYLKCHRKSLKIKSVLLDFDRRLGAFYDSTEYWHYNMFNHHFFGGSAAKAKFCDYLIERENEKCCLVTDPPFGCRTEPLAHTIRTITAEYQRANNFLNMLPALWVFPYYMENYIQFEMPQMEMLDYKINYTNHDTYHDGQKGRKQGSPVRIFTNIPPGLIKLPASEGYRYCAKCRRSVDAANLHCNVCKRCRSKNGSTYVHCPLCSDCVKPTYRHCTNCMRCTQVEGHQCEEFQRNATCAICLTKGHNELNCEKWTKMAGRSLNNLIKLKKKAEIKRKRLCLICLHVGHRERNCTKRQALLNEEVFLSAPANIVNSNEE